jgi:DUF917 family protein
VRIDGLIGTGDSGKRMELEFQNEIVLARCDGRIVCTVPDMVCSDRAGCCCW